MNITNPEKIKALIETQEFLSIRSSEEFYFQKGQDRLQEWLDLDISEKQAELFTLAKNYKEFKKVCEAREDLKPIAELLYTITSYCDTKAFDKEKYNHYEDKRSIARAGVYMSSWINHLLQYKVLRTGTGSTFNGFRYLLDPATEINVLSENHRRQISENILQKPYERDSFVRDITEFFDGYDFVLKNDLNKTHLIARILYTYKSDWFDEIIGLMAADTTGWQEGYIEESKGMEGVVLWNSKKPTGTTSTIKALRNIIDDGRHFNLYYTTKGNVVYKAVIKDFATDQEGLDKWDIPNKDLVYAYSGDFDDYHDDKRFAKIVFLADSIEKIDPVDINGFAFYNSSAPRQDNLSPIKSEPESIEAVDSNDPTNNDSMKQDYTTALPLNQILYGPPGTGKTYHTINKALEILNYNFTDKSRKEIKEDFEKRVKSGQIVFTTFHQSLSYEDFIEGLKPIAPKKEGDPVSYKVVNGIFKDMCKQDLPFKIGDDINGYKVESITSELLTLKKKRSESLLPLSFRMLHALNRFLHDKDLHIDKVKEKINFSEEDIASYPEIEPYLINGYNTIIPLVLERLNNDTKSEAAKILIIDEINRGNVSQIFGELITLIEKDKRIGNPEELTVTLPYSKDEFGVPNNLYIIGTMNTADRSVEALDSALRRRFVFEEMTPKPKKIAEIRKKKHLEEKIEDIDLETLLSTINNRIEKLIDRDHAIGHSYFLDCKDVNDLKDTFYKNIIPLLQEYFYGDYAKIGLVLGTGFVKVKESRNVVFAVFEHESLDIFNDRKLYEIIDYRKDIYTNESFEIAIKLLLGNEINTVSEGQE